MELVEGRFVHVERVLSANRPEVSAQARTTLKRVFCHVNQTRANANRLLLHTFHCFAKHFVGRINQRYLVWLAIAD